MISHPKLPILWISDGSRKRVAEFRAYLKSMRHIDLCDQPQLPANLAPYPIIITTQASYTSIEIEQLTRSVKRQGTGWLVLAHPTQVTLPQACGAAPVPLNVAAELRILFDQPNDPLGIRLPDAVYVSGNRHTLDPTDEQTETVMYADWHYDHRAVLTRRPLGNGWVAATTLQDSRHPVVCQVLYRLLRQLAGFQTATDEKRAALLGYAPSVGRLHGLGLAETEGLTLHGACDLDAQRRARFESDFPGRISYADADALAADEAIDLVIVTTPPNTHAQLSMQMLAAGKHVVSEKPLAITTRETAAMAAASQKHGVLLCCHQNRRFDADYLAIRRAAGEGLIGDLFYLETFVGGFEHPCGYWHSHAPICGGTTYDWGAHYLDWIVALMRQTVQTVRCTRQKRVWHDVTNADQERIQIRFEQGGEAEFLHSDIAAARKPKWYLLGTRGAIVGEWRSVNIHQPDAVHYYETHAIPETEMTPQLTAHCRDDDGRIYARELPAPRPAPFAFHRNLADHILLGEPLASPLEDSMQVVAILEAAARSAAQKGSLEVLTG